MWLNVIVYAAALFLLFMAWKAEFLDLHCPYPSASKEECCGDGCGMAYRGSKPDIHDDNHTLLDRINVASRTEERTVKWRRSYMLAWVIFILIWLAVFYRESLFKNSEGLASSSGLGGWPPYHTLIIFLFITTMVIYYSYSYYEFHHYDAPMRYIRESTQLLRERM